ncbi:MAG: hypothetical protein WB816_18750 [Methylocystis sp.]
MNALVALSGPIFGMVGVIAGTVLNEYLRRSRRAEEYSGEIFKRRLNAYEVLIGLIDDGGTLATKVIENADLTSEERHDIISLVIAPIAKHVDQNVLYIDGDLGAHCVALFMGVEDIHDAPESEKPGLLQHYYDERTETLRMIAEDSGVARINRLFQSINRPKITGALIERIREHRRERQKVARKVG